ncbi:MAG: formylmethanofuran dehydrogenase subunit E family protein [Brumimicrobium sp.]
MKLFSILILSLILFVGCSKVKNEEPSLKVIDTDFSKGRLNHEQKITLSDLVKFHGHKCDGLVVGFLAIQEAMKELYPKTPLDRTDLRIVSKSSPCLTDVAIYLTGGRYQFSTFYVDNDIDGLFVIQRISDQKTITVNIKEGVIPRDIKSMGKKAVQQELSPCDLDNLKKLEDDFSDFLISSNSEELFQVDEVKEFEWKPTTKNDYIKTDILNKLVKECM